ncbi:hypothetical protein HAX54_035871 [Datura stramonium]|uniref:Uncharacterized protein n=1 Tax=Datura stramonium TaxID=4076 RepID=A0ABS8SGK8_DATST|nr:hypothetical protein [Datura stramonium]
MRNKRKEHHGKSRQHQWDFGKTQEVTRGKLMHRCVGGMRFKVVAQGQFAQIDVPSSVSPKLIAIGPMAIVPIVPQNNNSTSHSRERRGMELVHEKVEGKCEYVMEIWGLMLMSWSRFLNKSTYLYRRLTGDDGEWLFAALDHRPTFCAQSSANISLLIGSLQIGRYIPPFVPYIPGILTCFWV